MLCVLEDTPPVTNTNISRGTCKMQFSLGHTVFRTQEESIGATMQVCVSTQQPCSASSSSRDKPVFDNAAHFTRSAKMAGASDPSVTTELVA
jgi:hypothetical protein